MPKDVYLPIGLPGIGKSTTLKKMIGNKPHTWVSPDDIRLKVNNGKAFVLATEPEVWRQTMDQFTSALASNKPETDTIVIDAVNLTKSARSKFLAKVRKSGAACLLKVLQFPMDVELAMKRQEGRARKVSRTEVEKKAQRFEPFQATEAKGMALEEYTVTVGGDAVKNQGKKSA